MLASMTGFGAASTCENGYVISTEIKAVNNRFLKTSIRLPDGFAALESKIEERLRTKLARGSVNFSLRLEKEAAENEIGLNSDALNHLAPPPSQITAIFSLISGCRRIAEDTFVIAPMAAM